MTMYVRHVNMIGHENTGSHLWKFVTWRFVYRGLTLCYSVFISVPPSDWIFYFLNSCNRFVLFSVYQGTRKPNIKETVDGLIHTRTYFLVCHKIDYLKLILILTIRVIVFPGSSCFMLLFIPYTIKNGIIKNKTEYYLEE